MEGPPPGQDRPTEGPPLPGAGPGTRGRLRPLLREGHHAIGTGPHTGTPDPPRDPAHTAGPRPHRGTTPTPRDHAHTAGPRPPPDPPTLGPRPRGPAPRSRTGPAPRPRRAQRPLLAAPRNKRHPSWALIGRPGDTGERESGRRLVRRLRGRNHFGACAGREECHGTPGRHFRPLCSTSGSRPSPLGRRLRWAGTAAPPRAAAMRLYSLSVLYKGEPRARLLKAAYDVSSFSFFQRSSVQEFMTFTSQLIVERSALGSRASVKEQDYLCHVYVRSDGLAGVVIADNEYPQRVCFTLLDKVLDEFSRQVSKMDWPSASPASINYSALDGYLSKYQNPRDADPMTRVQAELDETKIILHNTMESLLERGEKLDDLVSKSEVLGAQSKAFYKTARKQNSCCEIM